MTFDLLERDCRIAIALLEPIPFPNRFHRTTSLLLRRRTRRWDCSFHPSSTAHPIRFPVPSSDSAIPAILADEAFLAAARRTERSRREDRWTVGRRRERVAYKAMRDNLLVEGRDRPYRTEATSLRTMRMSTSRKNEGENLTH